MVTILRLTLVLCLVSGAAFAQPIPGGGGGGAAAFPLTAAGSTQSVGQMTVTGANAGMAVVPNGTGALMAAIPDGTSTGGNARGANAQDLQTQRSGATQVASGAGSFAAGRNNIASGAGSVSVGDGNTASSGWAIGNGNTANGTSGCFAAGASTSCSGQSSVGIGASVTASGFGAVVLGSGTGSGSYSFVSGKGATDHGNAGAFIRSGNVGVLIGQSEEYVLYTTTAGSTAVRLTNDNSSATTSNVANLPNNNTSHSFNLLCVFTDLTTRATLAYTLTGGILQRGANAASTTIGTTGNPTLASTSATPPTITVTLAADTTNAGLDIEFTPPVANTDTWHAACRVASTWIQ